MATELERFFGLTEKNTRPLMRQGDMDLPFAPSGREMRGRIFFKPKPLIDERLWLDTAFAFLLTFVGAMIFLL